MLNLLLATCLLLTPTTCECYTNEDTTNQVELNDVIVDNQNVKVTLLDVTETNDEEKGKQIIVKIDLENKTNLPVVADGKLLSSDGRMIDESMIILWGEVESGKVGTLELEIFEVDGYDFPKLEDNLEFTLYLFSWNDKDYIEEIPIKIEF